MSFLFYFFVLLIAASSVLFGLDWLSSPLPPMPKSKPAVHVASTPAPAKPPIAQAEKNAKLSPIHSAAPGELRSADADAAKAAQARPTDAESASAHEQASQTKNAGAPSTCNVNACASAYHTFRASDCTYQPYDGPRRLCTKGAPPAIGSAAAAVQAGEARAQASCNVAACERAYQSFDSSDCTYQPYNGPRRLCAK
jgi:hypothetical protein